MFVIKATRIVIDAPASQPEAGRTADSFIFDAASPMITEKDPGASRINID